MLAATQGEYSSRCCEVPSEHPGKWCLNVNVVGTLSAVLCVIFLFPPLSLAALASAVGTTEVNEVEHAVPFTPTVSTEKNIRAATQMSPIPHLNAVSLCSPPESSMPPEEEAKDRFMPWRPSEK